MPPKSKTIFSCTNCGAQYQKWTGRCLECGQWSTVEKNTSTQNITTKPETEYSPAKTKNLKEIDEKKTARLETKISELDRVLGGGVIPGSLVLLGGEPGIGKSTLSLQIASTLPSCLYVSGEESLEQIKLRANRLKVNTDNLNSAKSGIKFLNEINIDVICATIKKERPAVAFIDSIQTVYTAEAEGTPGNLNQIKASVAKLSEVTKNTDTAIFLIGHVTKDGQVAGPKTLEHLVDTVLYFEGEKYQNLKILRAVKNRFGATDEVGIFEMGDSGLKSVKNPSEILLSGNDENTPGSIITCLIEGSRPLLVEVQSLVNKTSFGYPVRKTSGFDINRLHLLTAVLQKRAGLKLEQYDIHLNIVGGIKADEPAVDLAVAMAIASSYKDKPLQKNIAVFGEIGLSGEVRPVTNTDRRLKECEKLGIKHVITNLGKQKTSIPGVKIISVKNIAELVKQA